MTMKTEQDSKSPAIPPLPPVMGSANFRVHDALGNWMIEDRQMGRMIAMSTRERDAKFIAEALNAYSPNAKAEARGTNTL